MKTTTYDKEKLALIQSMLNSKGVYNYRFCVENDCYACDRQGNFYSVCRRQHSKAGRVIENFKVTYLKGSKDRYGYVTYRITVNGEKKHLKAHRMMLNAWIGQNDDLVVNHKDGNKANNSLENLEWCTVAENNAHAIKMGLINPHAPKKYNYAVPISEWITIYILFKHCGFSYSELGRMNNCAHETIKKIVERVSSIMPEEVG